MLCPQCGTENHDGNQYCTNCQYDFSANGGNQSTQQPNGWQANPNTVNQPYQQQPNGWQANPNTVNQPYQQPNGWQANPNTVNNYPTYQKPFHSHLAISIVSIFFFTIIGIIATVTSNQANNAYRMGNYPLAESKAHTAKTLAIVSIVLGSLMIIGKLCTL